MDGLVNYFRKLLFQLRWIFMSPEKRYVYLWNQTNPRYRYYKQ